MPFHIRTLCLVASVLALASPVPGGDLEGHVRTREGTAVPQVVVSVKGPQSRYTVVSGPSGRIHVGGLPAGEYVLTAEVPGFVVAEAATVTIPETGTREASLVLAPAAIREQVLVSATRGDAAASTLGNSATLLDRDHIEEREAADLARLLEEVPGIAISRAGGVGRQTSAFVRGGESRFARVLVDGVPVNEPGGLQSFGTQTPLEIERIEVVRGAASSLYGTDALAGVIHVFTRRALAGAGPGVHGEVEGGGFDWRRATGGTSGRAGRLDWNAGLCRLTTDNEGPNSRFEQTAGALSAGLVLGTETDVRFAVRVESSDVGTPGQIAYGRPDLDARQERDDVVVSSRLRHVRGRAAHELFAGLADSAQSSFNTEDSGPFRPRLGSRVGTFDVFDFTSPDPFLNDTRRLTAGYLVEAQAGGRHLVTAGVDLEHETGTLGRAPEIVAPARTNVGVFVQDRMALGTRVFVTLGGRVERNDSYGTEVVPRAAVAVRLRGGDDATTLRASGGTGIKEPTFFESFGVSFYAKGNPELEAERSRTFDLGLEQRLLAGRVRLEATAFQHRYLKQIAYQVVDFDTFQGTYVNLGETRARGLELALTATPVSVLRVTAQYTLTDGKIVTSGNSFDPLFAADKPLLRRPRHRGAISARVGGERLNAGATLVAVGARADSDFLGLGLEEADGHTRVDARVHGRLTRALEAFAVAENVFDRAYEEVLGYPALGRSVRVGLRLRTGGPRS
jgi:vitamin B12 transporter